MLRLLTDPVATPRARRILRSGGLRRPLRPPRRTCAPSTDDLGERRRELAELGRLAVAYAMRSARVSIQSAASVPKS